MIKAYPKRLIEVDLPIKRISAHSSREKSIRHGHISTLHMWWARRPLAACRAVICASLWPDPADPNCPQSFRDTAAKILLDFAKASQSSKWGAEICDVGSFARYMRLSQGTAIEPSELRSQLKLRSLLLDFIADFAAWKASTNRVFLETARVLTQSAHESLGGDKGTRPLVVDPFAGGGSIPLEALRVGADAFASDLNPVAVLLNKVVLEYIPKGGKGLADSVRTWGTWIAKKAAASLSEFYPTDADGATPIAYLWARTITCEGPTCGAEVPLIKTPWLAKKPGRHVHLRIEAKGRLVTVAIGEGKDGASETGTIKRGSVTCPVCGYTTPVERVREQLRVRHGGTEDARLFATVLNHPSQGTIYRIPTNVEKDAATKAKAGLSKLTSPLNGWPRYPDEATPTNESHRSVGSLWIYGMREWRDIYTPRQLLLLTTLCGTIAEALEQDMESTTGLLLCLCISKLADYLSSLCLWRTARTCVAHTFGRQALPLVWDFGEMNPFAGSAGDWSEAVDSVVRAIEEIAASTSATGHAQQADATQHPLPEDSAEALVTDPPYYDAVVYAELADYFYVWLKRCLPPQFAEFAVDQLTPKKAQAVVYHPNSKEERKEYERRMSLALAMGRSYVKPSGVAVIVFAHKSTAGWESMLQAVIDGGWIITASWPIDTERSGRMNAVGTASLASSVHLVCRPREKIEAISGANDIGDWRDVLAELPKRTRQWMKRLGEEGVVGADAIFACLGPALEIFSRYSRVEKASGEQVMLKEYLTYVWGAVAQEALAQIFKDADATGFEEDARLTAMWLWTLNAGSAVLEQTKEKNTDDDDDAARDEDETEEEEGSTNGKAKGVGYVLEFDAARKIAQGLGAHLEQLTSVIEVNKDKARLLSVAERTRRLFGKDEAEAPRPKAKKKDKQLKLFSLEEVETEEGGWGDKSVPKLGDTVLDRIHQSMILFAAGRGEAIRRFLVEDGAGRDQRFWKLAQALSALYPQGTDEKRWVDGVLARKKGLGL